MADWVLRHNPSAKLALIYQQSVKEDCSDEKVVFEDKNVALSMRFFQPYRSQPKLLSYALKYRDECDVALTWSSFSMIFSKSASGFWSLAEKQIVLDSPGLDSGVCRLIQWSHKEEPVGYCLVGRWRLNSGDQVEQEVPDAD